jgi:hypothetical protein
VQLHAKPKQQVPTPARLDAGPEGGNLSVSMDIGDEHEEAAPDMTLVVPAAPEPSPAQAIDDPSSSNKRPHHSTSDVFNAKRRKLDESDAALASHSVGSQPKRSKLERVLNAQSQQSKINVERKWRKFAQYKTKVYNAYHRKGKVPFTEGRSMMCSFDSYKGLTQQLVKTVEQEREGRLQQAKDATMLAESRAQEIEILRARLRSHPGEGSEADDVSILSCEDCAEYKEKTEAAHGDWERVDEELRHARSRADHLEATVEALTRERDELKASLKTAEDKRVLSMRKIGIHGESQVRLLLAEQHARKKRILESVASLAAEYKIACELPRSIWRDGKLSTQYSAAATARGLDSTAKIFAAMMRVVQTGGRERR